MSPPPERQQGSYSWVKTLSSSHSCSMHYTVSRSQGIQSNVLTVRHSRIRVCSLFSRGSFCVCCLKSHFAPLFLTGKSGMYFVEDNAADVHDNQVMLEDCRGLFFVTRMTLPNVSQPTSTVRVFMCSDRAFTGRRRRLLSPGRTRRSRRCTSAGGSSETTPSRYSLPTAALCC